MSIEEAFKHRVSPERPENQRPHRESIAEPQKNKETEDVPKGNVEEYTEFSLHSLAQDTMFTAIPTGT